MITQKELRERVTKTHRDGGVELQLLLDARAHVAPREMRAVDAVKMRGAQLARRVHAEIYGDLRRQLIGVYRVIETAPGLSMTRNARALAILDDLIRELGQ